MPPRRRSQKGSTEDNPTELQEGDIIPRPVENPKAVPSTASAKKASTLKPSNLKPKRVKSDPKKESVGNNEPESASEKAPAPKKRATKVVEPRALLPTRLKRVQDPAGPDRPRAKHSSEEVAAAKHKEQEMRDKLVAIEKAKIVALAELEEAQKEAEEEEERARVAKWEDIQGDVEVHPDEDESDDGNMPKPKVCQLDLCAVGLD